MRHMNENEQGIKNKTTVVNLALEDLKPVADKDVPRVKDEICINTD